MNQTILPGRPEAFRTTGGGAGRSLGVRRQSEAATALWMADELGEDPPATAGGTDLDADGTDLDVDAYCPRKIYLVFDI